MINYFLFKNNNIMLIKLIIEHLNFQSKYNRLFLCKGLNVIIIQDVFPFSNHSSNKQWNMMFIFHPLISLSFLLNNHNKN